MEIQNGAVRIEVESRGEHGRCCDLLEERQTIVEALATVVLVGVERGVAALKALGFKRQEAADAQYKQQ